MCNPLTLEAFAEFCEQKPADEEYEFASFSRCACGQYATAIGIHGWAYSGGFWSDAHKVVAKVPGGDDDHTFGALATRLRAAIAEAR